MAGGVIVAKDAVDLFEVGVGELDLIARHGCLECVEGLHVLPPADIANEPGVIEHDGLATELHIHAVGGIADPGLINLGAHGIGNDRSMSGVGVEPNLIVSVFVQRAGVFGFDRKYEFFAHRMSVADVGAQREGVGAASPGLLNRLETRRKLEIEGSVFRNFGREWRGTDQ